MTAGSTKCDNSLVNSAVKGQADSLAFILTPPVRVRTVSNQHEMTAEALAKIESNKKSTSDSQKVDSSRQTDPENSPIDIPPAKTNLISVAKMSNSQLSVIGSSQHEVLSVVTATNFDWQVFDELLEATENSSIRIFLGNYQ